MRSAPETSRTPAAPVASTLLQLALHLRVEPVCAERTDGRNVLPSPRILHLDVQVENFGGQIVLLEARVELAVRRHGREIARRCGLDRSAPVYLTLPLSVPNQNLDQQQKWVKAAERNGASVVFAFR